MNFLVTVKLATIVLLVTAAASQKPAEIKVSVASIYQNDVTVHRNLRYGSKPESYGTDTSSDRTLDLYIPATKTTDEQLPVLVFVHGGGFSGGDKESTRALCRKISGLGFAVVSINYRLHLKKNKISGASASANMAKGLPVGGQFNAGLQTAIEVASEDTQTAFQWIKDHADQYQLNSTSVAISGGSAGAMTALYTAYVSNQKIMPIHAVIDLWGGLENEKLIKKGAAPLLIYHGDQDKLIHVDYAYALKKQMDKLGIQAELNVLAGKGHAIYNTITAEKTEEIAAFLRKTKK